MNHILIDYIRDIPEADGLEILIGPDQPSVQIGGKTLKYETLVNGVFTPETEPVNYIGLDIPMEVLAGINAKAIVTQAYQRKSTTIVLKEGCIGNYATYSAFVDEWCCYRPGGVHYKTKLIFL